MIFVVDKNKDIQEICDTGLLKGTVIKSKVLSLLSNIYLILYYFNKSIAKP